MNATLTKQEVQADMDATDRDIARIGAIVQNVSDFMMDSAGEDRGRFKLDLMKWETLFDKAVRLKRAIKEKLDEFTS